MLPINMSEQRFNYIVLGILLAFTVLIRLPILVEPWGGDQAGFGYIAKGMLEGKVPYKDMYSLTGYGVFFTFALFFKLFGMTMASTHIGHLLVSLVTVALVFFLTKRLYGKNAALIAALCYTVFSNGLAFSGCGYENKSFWGTYWYLSQREVFMAPLIMGAVFLAITSGGKGGFLRYFIGGLLIGLAAFYKATAILILFLFFLLIAGDEWARGKPFKVTRVTGRSLCVLSGFALINLPFLYYFWSHDALREVYQALFVHVGTYAKLSRGLRIETLFSGHYSIMGENLILWLFTAISCLYMTFKDRTRDNIVVVLWCLFSLLMVWGQGKFFGYHFILLMPPFAVLTGYGLSRFLERGPGLKGFFVNNLTDMRKAFMLTTVFMGLFAFGISNYDHYRWYGLYALGKISKQNYYDVFNEFPTHPYSFRSNYQIVEYLKKNADPQDRLGVVFSAGDTVIHFLTKMEPATRFIQSWYLFSSDEVLFKNEITTRLRREFVDQLIDAAPRFILCVHIPLQVLIETPCLRDDPSVRRLGEFIHAHYTLETFPDNRFLYRKI